MLKNITLEILDVSQENGFDLSHSEIIEVDVLKHNETKHLFFQLVKKEDIVYSTISFKVQLNCENQELDNRGNPHGRAYKDIILLDNKVDIKSSDYFLTNQNVNFSNFK